MASRRRNLIWPHDARPRRVRSTSMSKPACNVYFGPASILGDDKHFFSLSALFPLPSFLRVSALPYCIATSCVSECEFTAGTWGRRITETVLCRRHRRLTLFFSSFLPPCPQTVGPNRICNISSQVSSMLKDDALQHPNQEMMVEVLIS